VLWTAQTCPEEQQSRRLNHSPTNALIDLKVGCGLCCQIKKGQMNRPGGQTMFAALQ